LPASRTLAVTERRQGRPLVLSFAPPPLDPGTLKKFVQRNCRVKDWPCWDAGNDGKEQRFDRKHPTSLVAEIAPRYLPKRPEK